MSTPFNVFDLAYRADPYPTLARLRTEDPVHRDRNGVWIVTPYRAVDALHRDLRLGRDYRRWSGYSMLRPFLADSALERSIESWFLYRDPPDHTRLRRLAAHAFTSRAVAAMRPALEATADALLTSLADDEQVEFISEFAEPFPIRVIARLMGLPESDFELIKPWFDALNPAFEPGRPFHEREAAEAAITQLHEYLRPHVAARRLAPTDDLIGWLVAAQMEDESLDDHELLAMLVLLVFAGHQTTANLIGNGILALLRHPLELQRMRDDPTIESRAVEELLRYDSPVVINARVALESLQVCGQTIDAGDLVFCMVAAANRDPEIFADPDRLDLGRDPNPHVSFGGGGRYCLGAPLARLEARVAFRHVLERWPNIALCESGVEWRDFVNLRGLKRLPLRIDSDSGPDSSTFVGTIGRRRPGSQ